MLTGKSAGLLLAGLAAFAWYKYAKMSAEEKRELTDNIKNKGKKIFNSLVRRTDDQAANGQPFEGTRYAG